ncbi:MAG TPA: PfkB family carbohydrate kinase [Candidatus Dormibacteraeota bacterium]
MTWDVAVAGTLHRDDIVTPHGRRWSLGGSAVYFALAASRYAPVHVNGIVGEDTAAAYESLLRTEDIDVRGVVVSATPTFVWHATHDFERWVTAFEAAEHGCDPEWRPALGEASRAAPVLFLGSMHPGLQRAVLEQSRARLVGADSMTVFMQEDREGVRAVVASADVLFLNNEEVELLAGIPDWQQAARSLCARGRLRAVVVKQGPDGAALVTASAVHRIDAHPVGSVVDPTGAGDALAGGFLGFCAREERDGEDAYVAALAEGVRCAAAAVAAFGADGLVARSTARSQRPADV